MSRPTSLNPSATWRAAARWGAVLLLAMAGWDGCAKKEGPPTVTVSPGSAPIAGGAVSESPGVCGTPWWRAGADLTGFHDADSLPPSAGACPANPSSYERALAPPPGGDHERWARQVIDVAAEILLPQPSRPAACGAVTWTPIGSPKPRPGAVLQFDGTWLAPGRGAVPAYLLMPRVSASAPFEARGGVVVFHGHDAGRAEVVRNTGGYQKAMAWRLAQAGFVVLAPDIVSWGGHDPLGDGRGKHPQDWKRYRQASAVDGGNGFITYAIVDGMNALTLLRGLTVAPDKRLDAWAPASGRLPGTVPAVHSVGVSGLSFGAQLAAYVAALDGRVTAAVLASGLIDSCDVLANDHHDCQRIAAFEGRLALWDLVAASAIAPRPDGARARIQVQQGDRDKILRVWGQTGLAVLADWSSTWPIPTLAVRRSASLDHTYLVDDAIHWFQESLAAPTPRRDDG